MPSIASDCGGFDSNGGCLRATGDGFGGGLSVAGGGGGRLDVVGMLAVTALNKRKFDGHDHCSSIYFTSQLSSTHSSYSVI